MIPRPLSPHLQVYKLPFPALLSITHRLTGLVLVGVTWVFIIGLLFLIYFPNIYLNYYHWLSSSLGAVFLWGATACLYFHLLNGIRHLFWDTGYGFSLKATYISGVIVVLGSFLLTILTFCYDMKAL